MTFEKLSIYVFTLLISISLYVHVSRNENKYHGSYNYFRVVILSTTLLTLFEFLSWSFNGLEDSYSVVLNRISHYLSLYFSAIPMTLWFLYFDYRIYFSEKKLQNKRIFYLIFNFILLIVVTFNVYKPILFTFDETNNYIAKDVAWIIGGLQLLFLFSYTFMAIRHKKKIERKLFNVILLLSSLPVFATVLQASVEGAVMIWPSMTYIVFFAFLLIEREEMTKDRLTHLSLKSHMESRLSYLLNKDAKFTLILIDIDNFKNINDTYGLQKGDSVLADFAYMIQNAIHKVDTAYRYSGDEFIVLYESHDNIILDSIISKLKIQMKSYNKEQQFEEKLSMSYSFMTVDSSEKPTISELLNLIDEEMYENKT